VSAGADEQPYPSDVKIIERDGRTFVLVGTAHISQTSVDLVRRVIERERPDTVCIELDERRFQALREEKAFEAQDLREIIRNQQLTTLVVNLMLSAYQRRLGLKLGVTPGSELLEAAKTAEALEIPVALCDRDIRITLRRAWANLGLWRKLQAISGLMVNAFESPELSEEELERIREQDVLSELMAELGESLPELKEVLIDERDAYLAEKIVEAPGQRLVAVVGAGHVAGMTQAIESGAQVDLEEIESIPPVSSIWKWIGWAIPAFIVGSIAWIGWSQGLGEAGDNALFWFFANAVPAGVGALIALAHPITIVSAAVAAPFTSLTPVIGAGYVAAFVQLWVQPPRVWEFRGIGNDALAWKGWLRNRLLKILTAFVLVSLGSIIGSVVGGVEIARNLFPD
jgi:pheromone shutdown-related protein TraB